MIEAGLVDIQLEGYPFTWWRGRGSSNEVEERLDMAMTTQSWLEMFRNVKLSNLIAPISDHSPFFLLNCETKLYFAPRKNFRFENAWLVESELDSVVRDIQALTINVDFVQKIKSCTEALQRWGSGVRPNFKLEIKKYRKELEEARVRQVNSDDPSYDAIRDRFICLLIQEESYWAQRAKAHWLREGNQNTGFFHASASVRKKKKRLVKLQESITSVIEDPIAIQEITRNYFTDLF